MKSFRESTALYRKPQFGLTLVGVAAIWCVALPIAGTVLAWLWQTQPGQNADEIDRLRPAISQAWTCGVVYGWLAWLMWIMVSVRPRILGVVLLGTVASISIGVLIDQTDRQPEKMLMDVIGILVASATTNFLVGLPKWRFSRTQTVESDTVGRRQFSILGLLLGTTVIAMLIAIARQGWLAINPTIYWWVSVVVWSSLAMTSSLIYRGCLRVDAIGRVVCLLAVAAVVGLFLAVLCSAEAIEQPNVPSRAFALGYGVLIGGHLMTSTVLAAATCVQSLRDDRYSLSNR